MNRAGSVVVLHPEAWGVQDAEKHSSMDPGQESFVAAPRIRRALAGEGRAPPVATALGAHY